MFIITLGWAHFVFFPSEKFITVFIVIVDVVVVDIVVGGNGTVS